MKLDILDRYATLAKPIRYYMYTYVLVPKSQTLDSKRTCPVLTFNSRPSP